jgi:hypothetical protein
VKDPLEKDSIADAATFLLDLVHAPGGPGVHGRVDVPESPFVRGKLAVGVHVPLAAQEHQLLFGELRIHQRQRQAVKRQVPRRVPRILPLVRHRDHVGVVEMRPFMVTAVAALRRRGRLHGVALQPLANVPPVELLRPDHPR